MVPGMTRPHLFLDVDGVFGGFDEHHEALFGMRPDAIPDEQLWINVNADPDRFWGGMPLKAGALELWEVCRHLNPTFLTGCPRSGFEAAAAHKRVWLKEHFGDVPVITCLSRDKQLHMTAPGDVLLDDRHSNIRRWEKAGGLALLYRRPDRAIRDVIGVFRAHLPDGVGEGLIHV